MFSRKIFFAAVFSSIFLLGVRDFSFVDSAKAQSANARAERVFSHWTSERRRDAIPRDLAIDALGQGFLRLPGGDLVPYGREVAADRSAGQMGAQAPRRPPSGSDDVTGPNIDDLSPGTNDTIGSSAAFSALITDESGVKSVSFVITYPSGLTRTFKPGQSGDVWSIVLGGFSDGNWGWHVEAKDKGPRGGNSSTSGFTSFVVDTAGSGTGDGGGSGGDSGGTSTDTVTNGVWTFAGQIQTAAGRVYFEMPSDSRRKQWQGYVCSGTVVSDGATGRSIILTAAHCVYDDANKAFARNVLFIPDQAGTSGSGTDLDCGNDPLGCWAPAFGVVDNNWAVRTFPDNMAWDYAFYVVEDGAENHAGANSDPLDGAVVAQNISFGAPTVDDGDAGAGSPDFTHALGYSYSEDPKFMYCAEDITTRGAVNWWLPSCGLSGGSSGGAWVQPMDEGTGSGPIVSVNSWGYTTAPGMAGPKLSGTSAQCIFNAAKAEDLSFSLAGEADGDQGHVVISCP